MKNNSQTIQVTIISGFLGAGKTTFINQILKQNPEKKFALIENEFGEVGIDNQLIEAKTDTLIEMNQGCICCTLNEDLVKTLNHLLVNYSFDHLLIETTGVAEPSSVATPFLLFPQFKEKFHLSSVIVLVDAVNFEDSLKDSDLPARQVAFADVLIVNKIDVIEPEKLIHLESLLRALNPDAKQIFTSHAQVQTQELLIHNSHSHHYDHSHEDYSHSQHENHSHTEQHHAHEHNEHPYNAIYVTFDKPLDILKFQHWMNMMLQIQSGRIYRIKGWVYFYGFERPLLFQSVGKQYLLDRDTFYNKQLRTELVFIGLQLEKSKIQNILEKLMYKP